MWIVDSVNLVSYESMWIVDSGTGATLHGTGDVVVMVVLLVGV
jgi:hypothetical protein